MESGLPWLGQVPQHWVIKRGKSYLMTIDQRSKAGKEELLTVSSARGVVPRRSANVTMFKAESALSIALAEQGAEIKPVPTEAGGRKAEPELDRLSNILKAFNEQFGTLFDDTDRIVRRIRDDIAPKVAADAAFQNARENTPHTARLAHDQALGKVMQALLKDDTKVYKQFVENESFRRSISDIVFQLISCKTPSF